MLPSQIGVDQMDIVKDLTRVSISLRCPEVKDGKTVEVICNLISHYNKLETSEAYSIILEHIPDAIKAWKEGLAHNLSSAIYTRGRFYLLNAVRDVRRKAKYEEGTFSMDSQDSEESNLHETIAGKSESIDWKDSFDFLLGNAGFTDREKKVFLGMKDGKTLDQIGEQFSVSRQAIHESVKAIKNKSNRIKHKVMGRV